MKGKGVYHFLKDYVKNDTVSFHMPGHKGRNIYEKLKVEKDFFQDLIRADITEIEGADNLFRPEGIIRDTEKKYEELYHSKKSYLLINGTSCGLVSSILAIADYQDKIIMARNSHKSIYNAVKLKSLKPVYLYPEISDEYGLSINIKPEDVEVALKENIDAKLVILPSPNYYGICSDIEKIVEIVHREGKILIVDQAHGAHLNFFDKDLPKSAEKSGADIVVNSTHKTLGTLTQSAVLNVMTDRVNLDKLEFWLQTMESSSPSYLLMASLDLNADLIMEKQLELFDEWYENLNYFYNQLEKIEGITSIKDIALMDYTKINLNASRLGMTGTELEKVLIEHNIYPELVTGNIVMCMTGIGNIRQDYDRLLNVLKKVSIQLVGESNKETIWSKNKVYHGIVEKTEINQLKEILKTPLKKGVFSNEIVKINIEKSGGKTCYMPIIPYPPGIPIVASGEIISKDVIEYVCHLLKQGKKVMGVDEEKNISVFQ